MLQFSRRDDLQNTGFDPGLKILEFFWNCIFEARGSKVEGSISYNYRFHTVTRFKSYVTQITDVSFSQCLQRTGCVPHAVRG